MPSNCGKCGHIVKRVKGNVSCGDCREQYHLACSSMTEEDLRTLEDLQRPWHCVSCLERKRSIRSDTTPIKSNGSLAGDQPAAATLNEILTRIKCLQDEQGEIKKSLLWCHETMNELNKSISNVNSAIASLGEKLEKTIGDLCQLQKRVSELEQYTHQLEQETKRNVVEIQGVPIKEGEILSAIIHQIGLAIGVQVDTSDIDYVYRVKTRSDSDRPPIIMLRFLRQGIVALMSGEAVTAGPPGAVANGDEQERVIEEMHQRCLLEMAGGETPAVTPLCSRVWDGILCWGHTAAGRTATLPCPAYIAGFDPTANASRRCLEGGEWFWIAGEDGGRTTWTNYSQCTPTPYATMQITFPDMESNVSLMAKWVPVVKSMSRFGYSVSLISLVLAFVIMASIKKLRCPRNILHMHLFASFIMRAFMSLLKDSLFIEGIGLSYDVIKQNGGTFVFSQGQHSWECKMVVSLWQFFIMANYSWVLMEGLYLHNLIFMALFSDTSSITLYVILGWGFPVLVVVPWIVLRAVLEDTLCWTTNENPLFFLVIRIPIIATILINFVMFLNIVRVVFLKLQSSISEETRKYKFRRWAKSTLVLVPLFGVHYTVFLGMSYSMGVNQVVEIIWLFCDQFFASLQGLFIAVLYCFMNGEVRAELTKKWFHSRKSPKTKGNKSQTKKEGSDVSAEKDALNSGGAGGILFMFPQVDKSPDSLGRCKKVGFDGIESGTEDDERHCGSPKNTNSNDDGINLQAINMTHFPRFGRQMSAPAGSTSSTGAKLSQRGGWGSPNKTVKGSNTLAQAIAHSEFIQGTKRMARKWSESVSQFGILGRANGGSSFASASYDSSCTTNCSIDNECDNINEGTEFLVGEERDWSQDEAGAPTTAPPMETLDHEQRHHSLHRSLSDGAALRTKCHDECVGDWITVNETAFDEKDEHSNC
ncbi:uncharacterized protein [Hetaerina americana]|uniref:uncharacterized protein n=1 Tax=Hetaerina americana TaxID=62018 RepID=UPI003A7F4B9E